MSLTILTDHEVKGILLGLKKEEIYELQGSLAEALEAYASGDPNSPCCSSYQPLRTIIKKGNVSSVFMPAMANETIGMKIVTLSTPPKASSSAAAAAAAAAATSTSSSAANKQTTVPRGIVTILDHAGKPTGIMNAEEFTAFRTALAAIILLLQRQNVHTVTVFGAGKQAFWHIRLALIFKGDEIQQINIVNRSTERSRTLIEALQAEDGAKARWRKDIKFSALSPGSGENEKLPRDVVTNADVIFCCTAATEPLFPAEFLTSPEGQKKSRYISAIGSYAPHMTELHPDIFKNAASETGRAVVVDTKEGCLNEAGEIIHAELKPEDLVEIGELLTVKKSTHREIELGGKDGKGHLDWLIKGNVLYKSVGLGLMDLTLGWDLVHLARERNVGTTVRDF